MDARPGDSSAASPDDPGGGTPNQTDGTTAQAMKGAAGGGPVKAGRLAKADRIVLTVVCLAQFMVVLDISIVNVALASVHSGRISSWATERLSTPGSALTETS